MACAEFRAVAHALQSIDDSWDLDGAWDSPNDDDAWDIDLEIDIDVELTDGPELSLVPDEQDEHDFELADSDSGLTLVAADPARSEGKLPLPGLPPEPDPRAILASRVLRRFRPDSEAARMARAVVRQPSEFAEPAPVRPTSHRAGALPLPARSRVALASIRRHGAVCHIGPARRPTHARMARLGTPAPAAAPAPERTAAKQSFWSRLFVGARK